MVQTKKNKAKAGRTEKLENFLFITSIGLLVAVILADFILRFFTIVGFHLGELYKNLVIWVCFSGAIITTRKKEHFAIEIGLNLLKGKIRTWTQGFIKYLEISVIIALFIGSLHNLIQFNFGEAGGGIEFVFFFPKLIFECGVLAGFLVILAWYIKRIPRFSGKWLVIALAICTGIFFNWFFVCETVKFLFPAASTAVDAFAFDPPSIITWVNVVFAVILGLSLFFGTRIFIVLAGIAVAYFASNTNGLVGSFNAIIKILTDESIAAIPLFVLCGYILAEGNAGKRLVELFKALFGWMPAGLALASIFLLAFLTAFTGGSGISIVALGGLLSFVLIQGRYSQRFGQGLITSAGSIGLLFPPSLPLILYAMKARESITDLRLMESISVRKLFIGGLLPGLFMVIVIMTISLFFARKNKVPRIPFDTKKILPALSHSLFELLLPVFIIVLYFGGFMGLEGTSAFTVVYLLVVQVLIKRDLKPAELPRIILKSAPVIGGILIIMAAANTLSSAITDAQLPQTLIDILKSVVSDKYVFLLLLNIALLITGCLMDIYSAIIVVAPLVIPVGIAYGVDPVHLGIIFLANLELGFLTPPVGINLFLSSARFNKPLPEIYSSVMPFFIALLMSVLIITYFEPMSTFLVNLLFRGP